MTAHELRRRFPFASEEFIQDNADGVAPAAEPQRSVSHESVAAPKGKAANPNRRLVRLTSYRLRLLDERNLTDKWFVDSLVYAGILYSDAPKDCQVEVEQCKVEFAAEERTEITIEII